MSDFIFDGGIVPFCIPNIGNEESWPTRQYKGSDGLYTIGKVPPSRGSMIKLTPDELGYWYWQVKTYKVKLSNLKTSATIASGPCIIKVNQSDFSIPPGLGFPSSSLNSIPAMGDVDNPKKLTCSGNPLFQIEFIATAKLTPQDGRSAGGLLDASFRCGEAYYDPYENCYYVVPSVNVSLNTDDPLGVGGFGTLFHASPIEEVQTGKPDVFPICYYDPGGGAQGEGYAEVNGFTSSVVIVPNVGTLTVNLTDEKKFTCPINAYAIGTYAPNSSYGETGNPNFCQEQADAQFVIDNVTGSCNIELTATETWENKDFTTWDVPSATPIPQ